MSKSLWPGNYQLVGQLRSQPQQETWKGRGGEKGLKRTPESPREGEENCVAKGDGDHRIGASVGK